MATEEPSYEVVLSDGDMELRRYAPMLIAETEVEGDLDQTSSQGSRLIDGYIFGENQGPDAGQKARITMTAPVSTEPQSLKIAMSAPVTVEPQSVGTDLQAGRRWRIHFVMPSQYTLETIRKLSNPPVQLREFPARHYAVHRYSGLNTLSRVQSKTDELLQWASARSLMVTGTPQLAHYNPPWTLPMLRRNEIQLKVAAP